MLPAEAIGDHKPLTNTPESRLRFTESFVYAHLGHIDKTEQAQRQALALYPPSYPHGPAEVELLRALCQVRTGGIAEGIRHAYSTLNGLTHAERIRPIISLGTQGS
jgi:hypothetical protein